MNVLYKKDENLSFDTALIKTNPDFEDLQSFLDYIKNFNKKLTVKKGDNNYLIPTNDFLRFYSGAKSVYAQTDTSEYHISKRLYELEKELPVQFVRVSNSEIINLNYVSQFSLSVGGIINIEFKNGIKTSSSRRYLKKIKEILYHER